jgi:hypothetical protein
MPPESVTYISFKSKTICFNPCPAVFCSFVFLSFLLFLFHSHASSRCSILKLTHIPTLGSDIFSPSKSILSQPINTHKPHIRIAQAQAHAHFKIQPVPKGGGKQNPNALKKCRRGDGESGRGIEPQMKASFEGGRKEACKPQGTQVPCPFVYPLLQEKKKKKE